MEAVNTKESNPSRYHQPLLAKLHYSDIQFAFLVYTIIG